MAGDKRELILDLLARDKSGPGLKTFGKGLDDIADKATDADKATEKLGKSSDRTSKQTDKLGKEVSETARDIAKLDREIALATAELGHLARAFARTDDAAEKLDISRGIRKGENDIRRMTKAKGLLSSLLPDDPGPAAASFFSKLGGALSAGAGTLGKGAGNHVGLVIGASIGAAAGPTIISAVQSALAGGVGLGFIGAGIMLAVKGDPEIEAAGKAAGTKFGKGLATDTAKTFRGPILDSIGILTDAGTRLRAKLGGVFNGLSDDVVPFVRKVVQGVERLTDSLAGIADKSGPAIAALGDTVLLLSDGIGDMIDILADGTPQAAANLTLLAGATADLLRWTAMTVDQLGKLANNPWLTGPLLPLLKKHYKEAADASDQMKGSTSALAETMTNAAKAAAGQQAALSNLSKELQAQTDPVFGLLDAQDKLAEAQANVKDATEKHGRSSTETRKALRQLAEAALNLEGKAGALGDTFNGKLTPELRGTLRAAGLTERQISDLGGEFQEAKKKGNAFAHRYQASVNVNGAAWVQKQLNNVRSAANRIPNVVSIAMRITGAANASAAAAAVRKNVEGRASGGSIRKDTPYWVGENGPELVYPTHDARVLSAAASRNAVDRTSPRQGMGSRGGALRLELAGEAGVVTFVRSLIRTANLLED